MAKITSANGLVLDAETLTDPARGTSYLNGTQIENTSSGEKYTVSGQQVNTPQAVYTATRPLEWLPMIMPQDNEIYMLFHIYGISSLIAFKVTGCSYTVELGTVRNGAFEADSRFTQTKTSGTSYENEIFWADFGDTMENGGRQCMVKISAAGGITGFEVMPHSGHTVNNFVDWNITEWWGKLPKLTSINFSTIDTVAYKRLNSLKYFRLVGKNMLNSLTNLCCFLYGLTAILELEIPSCIGYSGLDYFMRECRNLSAIPTMVIPADVSLHYSFVNTNLKKVSLSFQNGKGTRTMSGGAFSGNSNLEEIEGLDTKSVTTEICINNNFCLKKLYIDTSAMNSYFQANNNCSMYSLLFNPAAPKCPTSISATYSAMSREALVAMFASLPVSASAHTVTITGSRGAAELTENDIAVATEKNWTVVI